MGTYDAPIAASSSYRRNIPLLNNNDALLSKFEKLSEFNVFSTGCLNGFESNGDHCYLLVEDEVTYQEAVDACQAKFAILIEPRTAELNEIAQSYAGEDKLWIGANDIDTEGTWVWVSDREALDFTDWADNQPNDGDGNGQDCAAMQGNGAWGDIQCTATRRYVCQTLHRKSTSS